LGEARVRSLIPNGRMMVETRDKHLYYRPSPDGTRIVIGGRAALHPVPLDEAAEWLMKELRGIFPSLADARVSHVWTGNVAMTRSDLPGIGQREGIWYALGCNGSGVALMPYLGHKVALQLLARQEGKTAFDDIPVYRRAVLQRDRVVPSADDVVVPRAGYAARALNGFTRAPPTRCRARGFAGPPR
jgi:glycine/D-amino acid oxidase-like deaminating enzyme